MADLPASWTAFDEFVVDAYLPRRKSTLAFLAAPQHYRPLMQQRTGLSVDGPGKLRWVVGDIRPQSSIPCEPATVLLPQEFKADASATVDLTATSLNRSGRLRGHLDVPRLVQHIDNWAPVEFED